MNVSTYVFMYVCMYTRTCVCMNVNIYVYMRASMYYVLQLFYRGKETIHSETELIIY